MYEDTIIRHRGGNAKKSKTFHPPQEEPITLGIDFNVMTQGSGRNA